MNKSRDIAFMGMLLGVMVISSWISIPMTVPFTLQTFAIFLTILVLGTWRGFFVVLTYITLGLVGLPVFSGFKSGIAAIAGPTGGYILGFLLTAIVAGKLLEFLPDKRSCRYFSMFVGLLICYAFGTFWFVSMYTKSAMSFSKALSLCVIPFVIPDILKILLADYIASLLKKVG